MLRISSHSVGIEQGDVDLFSDFANGGEMWTGHGARERRRAVRFSRPFSAPPAVHVGLSLWDMDSGSNLRADIAAEKITEAGFELVFRTWSDTRVARVRMSWIAVGAFPNEDDWQLY